MQLIVARGSWAVIDGGPRLEKRKKGKKSHTHTHTWSINSYNKPDDSKRTFRIFFIVAASHLIMLSSEECFPAQTPDGSQ